MGHLSFVIPSYGSEEYTDAIAGQLRQQGVPGEHVIVVDNAGTYRPEGPVTLVVPGSNLGWLEATNIGMELALRDPACVGAVWLNNDVTVASGFVDGLASALASGAWMAGPLYDGINPAQHPAGDVDVTTFVPAPEPVLRDVIWIEGTCTAVSRACFDAVGLLDAGRFGWRGWGADIDYALRAAEAGGRIVVTEGAFLHHEGQVTGTKIDARYGTGARREMTLGLRRRWGRGWEARYEVPDRAPSTRRGRLRVLAEEYGGIPQRRRVIRERAGEARRLRAELGLSRR